MEGYYSGSEDLDHIVLWDQARTYLLSNVVVPELVKVLSNICH